MLFIVIGALIVGALLLVLVLALGAAANDRDEKGDDAAQRAARARMHRPGSDLL
ncbi:MAG TPA: hypothetical protein VNO20_12435 [Solirubrobacterales bacterium]|nr:hypothetical protein [Solirubrobacterales bacterium]